MKLQYIITSFLILNFLSSCQNFEKSSVVNTKTKNSGRFYFHRIKKTKLKPNFGILVDGKKIEDIDTLDSTGIEQSIGGHGVEFKGMPFSSRLEEIEYNINKNQSFHLYYCESDGSLHGYSQASDGKFHIYAQSSEGSFNDYTQSVEEKRSELKKICR